MIPLRALFHRTNAIVLSSSQGASCPSRSSFSRCRVPKAAGRRPGRAGTARRTHDRCPGEAHGQVASRHPPPVRPPPPPPLNPPPPPPALQPPHTCTPNHTL